MAKQLLKRNEGLEEEILQVVSSKGPQTTSSILDAVKKKYPVTWKTIKSYCVRLWDEKKLKIVYVGSIPFWDLA